MTRPITQYSRTLADTDSRPALSGSCDRAAFLAGFYRNINAGMAALALTDCARPLGLDPSANYEPFGGAVAFAHFSARVAGCAVTIGNGHEGPQALPLHAAGDDFNDALLPVGAQFEVQFGAEPLRDRPKPAVN